MKRWLFALSLIVVLAGCSDSTDKESIAPETSTAQSTQESQVVAETPVSSETVKESTEQPESVEAEVPASVEGEQSTTSSKELVFGEPMAFEGFTMTITKLEIVKDYEELNVLKVTYDWENTSDGINMPTMSFTINGYQNGEMIDSTMIMSDDIDLGLGLEPYQAGEKITGAETGVMIADMDQPMTLELGPGIAIDDSANRSAVIDLNQLP